MAASIELSISEVALLLLLSSCGSYTPFEYNENEDDKDEEPDEHEVEDFMVDGRCFVAENDFL